MQHDEVDDITYRSAVTVMHRISLSVMMTPEQFVIYYFHL